MHKERPMTKRYFCTLFDSGYLLKGLAMIRSLARFCPEMKIYVLCMDDQTKAILEHLNIQGFAKTPTSHPLIPDSKFLRYRVRHIKGTKSICCMAPEY
jgi:hypothetical protein